MPGLVSPSVICRCVAATASLPSRAVAKAALSSSRATGRLSFSSAAAGRPRAGGDGFLRRGEHQVGWARGFKSDVRARGEVREPPSFAFAFELVSSFSRLHFPSIPRPSSY